MDAKWIDRMLGLAHHVSRWSRDPSTKVGAVVADDDFRVLGLGYNGFPRGVQDLEERLHCRPTKLLLTVHAETNALLNCNRSPTGANLFVLWHPCAHCAAVIIQSGIARVIMPPTPADLRERWGDSIAWAEDMFKEAGVEIIEVDWKPSE